jgi:hypothetical protein
MKMDAPPHLAELLAAYVEITRLPVAMTYARAQALTLAHERGLTPDDIREVMRELKRLITKKPDTYGEACLTFRNAIEDVDRLEERALQLRQRNQRARGSAPKADVAQTRKLPDGGTVTVLAPAAEPQPDHVGKAVAAGLREFRQNGLQRSTSNAQPPTSKVGDSELQR